MAEMEPLFQELIATLRDARTAVNSELEPLVEAQAADKETLLRIPTSVRSFGDQAGSLYDMLIARDADAAWIEEAEDLHHFFRSTEEQIAAMVGTGRR